MHDDASAANTIALDDFLKVRQVVGSGGHAKVEIQAGNVLVNGVVETRRRRKLVAGDIVDALGERHVVDGTSIGRVQA